MWTAELKAVGLNAVVAGCARFGNCFSAHTGQSQVLAYSTAGRDAPANCSMRTNTLLCGRPRAACALRTPLLTVALAN
eukprot:5510066-Amphidinium_carterae.1